MPCYRHFFVCLIHNVIPAHLVRVQDFADIESVFVNPNYRGKGIAKSLLTVLEKELKEVGIQNVLLEVRSSNLPALSLYKGFGFEEISVRKKYYPDGEDALVLKKVIV